MFTEEQKKSLEAPLDRSQVSTREQGGKTLSYVEGWWVIAEANRIFGFGEWDRETVFCEEVSRADVMIGKTSTKPGYPGFKVGYRAMVRIVVRGTDRDTVARTGTGLGSGISKDLYEAIEGAAKEAETDAMKRALMTFGNPFGLALYDKSQKNVADVEKPKSAHALRKDGDWDKAKEKVDAATDVTHLDLILNELAPEIKKWNEGWRQEFRAYCKDKRAELQIKEQLGETQSAAE